MKKNKNYIPKNAKLVFKWKVYETWQWEQKMYDGTNKIFEKVKKSNTVTIIAIVNNEIIIQEQEQPHRDLFISLPGWKCEKNETPLEAARRELLEETWYISNDIKLWKKIPSLYSSLLRESYYYIAKDCKKIQWLNLDNGEKINNNFIRYDNFLLLSENKNFRDIELVLELLRIRLSSNLNNSFKKQLFDK